jgi:hypothetical protein
MKPEGMNYNLPRTQVLKQTQGDFIFIELVFSTSILFLVDIILVINLIDIQ